MKVINYIVRVGDMVAVRGDMRINMDGRCAYEPEQLVMNKYLKHTGNHGIWVGAVTKVNNDMAFVASFWISMDRLVPIDAAHRDLKRYELF